MNYPLLDGRYIYDKIKKKVDNNKEINFLEKFYLWSIYNRSKVIYVLLIITIISIIINDINNYKNDKIVISSLKGGSDDNLASNEIDSPKKSNFANKAESFFTKNLSFRKRKIKNMSKYELERYKQLEETKINNPNFGSVIQYVNFFPLIDKLFGKLRSFVYSSKIGYVIAIPLIVYGFGIVVIPLIIIFLFIKYTLRLLIIKSEPIQKFNIYKKKYKTSNYKKPNKSFKK
jgi:hypothetical protein